MQILIYVSRVSISSSYKRPYDKGNLYVKFNVIFPPPNWVPQAQLKDLEAILPPRKPLPSLKGVEVEEVVLSTIDPMQQKRANYEEATDNEDGEHEGGGPQVQCAQQ
jgi:DnaJ family protein A protein 2